MVGPACGHDDIRRLVLALAMVDLGGDDRVFAPERQKRLTEFDAAGIGLLHSAGQGQFHLRRVPPCHLAHQSAKPGAEVVPEIDLIFVV